MSPRLLLITVCCCLHLPLVSGSGLVEQEEGGAMLTPAADNASRPFLHPGLLHSAEDFNRMREKVRAGEEPWKSGWEQLLKSPLKGLEKWRPRPTETSIRGGQGDNIRNLYRDAHAAYQCALRWQMTGEEQWAAKAVEILNAWSGTLKAVSGNNDRFLASGIYGYQLANVGEIMRTWPAWKEPEQKRFQAMMLEAFYPLNHDFLVRHNNAAITNYFANWDLCNIASMLAIGVLCDRRDIYDEAVGYYLQGGGNGAADRMVYFLHPGFLGQWQESGRDQGHTIMGIGLAGAICEMAWKQGDDLYSHHNNRLLAGAEYVARYNLGLDVPFQPYAWGVGPKGRRSEVPVVSPAIRGQLRPVWELVYHHYVNRMGLAAPYTLQMVAKVRPENGADSHGSTYDQLGYGTLTCALDPFLAKTAPSRLQVWKQGARFGLSWWGAARAESYQVSRAKKEGGPYEVVARGIRDHLYFEAEMPAGEKGWYRVVGLLPGGEETPASAAVLVEAAPKLVFHAGFESTQGADSIQHTEGRNEAAVYHGGRAVPGKDGQAWDLDGVDDYLALPGSSISALSDLTLAMWVNLRQVESGTRLFDFGGTPGSGMTLSAKGDKGVRFAAGSVYQYNEVAIEGESPLPVNQWVHVAFTLAGKEATLYVNGKVVGTHAAMSLPPVQLGSMTENWVGKSHASDAKWLNGRIDDVRVYDGALSAADVGALLEKRSRSSNSGITPDLSTN